MANTFIRVCSWIYNGISPSTFARHLGPQYLPQMAEVIPHHLALPPRCSRHEAESCCTAQTARDAWRANRTSALTSVNRRAPGMPERACGTDATLVQSPEHSPGVRCKVIHAAVFSARHFRGLAMLRRMYKCDHFWPGELGSVGPGSNRSARFRVMTHRFGLSHHPTPWGL